MLYGIEQGKGFLLVTGEVGTGKTMLARSLKERLPENTLLIEVTTPWITAKELFRLVARKVDVTFVEDVSESALLDAVRERLLELQQSGKKVVVIIDEAQQLTEHTLEAVRQLSNLESDTSKLIQIVLMGQTEMAELLARHSMRPLRQRIALNRQLSNLGKDDVINYIGHRLEVVGGSARIFTREALDLVFQYSRGIPRVINLICDNALITAFASGQREVQASTVSEVVSDMPMALPAFKQSTKADSGEAFAAQSSPRSQASSSETSRSEKSTSEPQYGRSESARERSDAQRADRVEKSEAKEHRQQDSSSSDQSKPVVILSNSISTRSALFGGLMLIIIVVLITLLIVQSVSGNGSSDKEVSGSAAAPASANTNVYNPDSASPSQVAPAQVFQPSTQQPQVAPNQPTYGANQNTKYLPAPNNGASQSSQYYPSSSQQVEPAPTSMSDPNVLVPFPFRGFGQNDGSQKQMQSGEPMSVLARREFHTWNDTIEDIVRESNPQLPTLDAVAAGDPIWLPNVTKTGLVVQARDGGWYVYFASFKSRIKAQDQADTFLRLGDPAEVIVHEGANSVFYRVYLGAFTNKADAEDKAQSLWYRYMPLLN